MLFYVLAGDHMLRLMYSHVQKQKGMVIKIEKQQDEFLSAEMDQREREAAAGKASDALRLSASRAIASPFPRPLLFQPHNEISPPQPGRR